MYPNWRQTMSGIARAIQDSDYRPGTHIVTMLPTAERAKLPHEFRSASYSGKDCNLCGKQRLNNPLHRF